MPTDIAMVARRTAARSVAQPVLGALSGSESVFDPSVTTESVKRIQVGQGQRTKKVDGMAEGGGGDLEFLVDVRPSRPLPPTNLRIVALE